MENTNKSISTAASLERLQKIANIGNWEFDFSSGRAVWSEVLCGIYGVPTNENIHSYDEWESFLHPEDLDTVRATIAASKKTFSDFNVHYRIVRKDSSVKHLYSHVEYQYNNQGAATGLYGVAHDITEIISIKTNLVKSEANIRLIMDLIPMSIYARDAQGYYIFGNHVFLNHYGITADGLKHKHLRDLVRSQAEYDELWGQDQHVLESDEKLFVSEFMQTDHTGEPKAWRIIKVPFTPEGHTKKAILGIAEDITMRKKQEKELMELTNALSVRNNDLERFSQMVSHDLRGPLSTLMGVSEVIDNIKLEQEDISIFIGGIKQSLLRLDKIVRELNDITTAKD